LDQGTNPSTQIPQKPNRRFKFQKSRQFLIGVHNEALTVAAMRVGNPDGSSAKQRNVDGK
jgi:hypothetical protein